VTILLVRLRLIGDVVFTTPVIRAIKRAWPDARLTYLVERSAHPVVEDNPHLDEVLAIDHTRGWRRLRDDLRLAGALRRRHFDVAVDLHGGPRSAWLTWMSRARLRVGYDVAGRAWMYSRTVHRPRELRPRHSVENQWDLLAAVDGKFTIPPDRDHDRVQMEAGGAARDRVAQRLERIGVGPAHQVAVVHVSAGNPFRRWPEAAFGELVAGLVAGREDRWVLVTSGPSDHDAAARVVASARVRAGAAGTRIVDAEGLSLKELRAMMDRAAVFVGGDSGPLHVASTSDVPIVGLYGPTLPARSAPWRPVSLPTRSIDAGALSCRPCDQRRCEPGDYRCLTSITAAGVLAAAEQLMETRS